MILHYFRKKGGVSLLKKYAQNHILFYAAFMFLALPKNRFGLEILSECIDKKIQSRLRKKYRKIIQQTDYILAEKQKPKTIWFCWLQGLENAPDLVKVNYKRVRAYFSDYEIHIITAENYADFAEIPDYIIEKWRRGIITHTHFSDILRTNLLVAHGGIWIDATVFVTGSLPSDIADAPLFLFRTQKPGGAGKCITVSSWFIESAARHPVLRLVQDLLFAYWKKQKSLCDYFLFHHFVEISLRHFSDLCAAMPKYSNEPPHILLYELAKPYENEKFESIVEKSFVHKLTVKLTEEEKSIPNTVYARILAENNPKETAHADR